MTRPLRGALVGYGFIGANGHAAAYRERARSFGDVEIAAVADGCERRRERACAEWPGIRIYNDYSSLLREERGNLDFVDIATPPCDHAVIAHAAFDQGLHVLCEKPLATSVEDARSMLHHAVEARRVLFPCHNYKHAPVVKEVRALIERQAVGPVHLVTLQTFRNTHAKGVAEWRPDWRRERRYSGGGIAMDHGSHTFYLAFEWLRSYPTEISARMSSRQGCDTEDDFSCSLSFPTGTVSAHLSWTSGVRKVIYTLHGDRGAIRVEDDEIEVAVLDESAPTGTSRWQVERRSVPSHWMDASHVRWFSSLFEEFRRAIQSSDYAGREAREAFLCVQLITTAYESASASSRSLALSSRV